MRILRWSRWLDTLALALSAAACSGTPAPDLNQLSGDYQLSGVGMMLTGIGDAHVVKITVISSTSAGVILDIDSADVNRRLPVRDTAYVSGDHYTLTWTGGGAFSYSLVFNASDCTGYDVTTGGDRIAWATCSILRGR